MGRRHFLGRAAALALALAAPLALAQANEHTAHHSAPAASATEGEVRKVDKEARKITIRHGPIANLDMPAMTMVFRAADPGMLDRVKAGDKVRFTADKVDGQYTVVWIEPVR